MPESQSCQSVATDESSIEFQNRLEAEKLRVVRQLAGGIAHDFNNFLMLISFCSEQLLAQIPERDAHRKTVMAISDAGSRAAGLIRQLLAFSQQQVLETSIVDLNELIVRADQVIRRLINGNILVTLKLTSAKTMVNVSPEQFDHVLLNLILNAQDAMPEGGRLTIETSFVEIPRGEATGAHPLPLERYIQLSVSDIGCGMTDDVKAKVFEPYFTTKEPGKGTGLGLSVVYGIVSQFGGQITVTSNVGMGTRFEIRLPAAPDKEVSPAPICEQSHSSATTETILLVEDDAILRRFLKSNLESHGYNVLEAPHGPAAIAVAIRHSQRIDMLLTDVELPEMSGYAIAETLQADYPGLPTLFMSGFAGDSLRRGHSNRSDSFLQKPFKSSDLLAKVREVLNR